MSTKKQARHPVAHPSDPETRAGVTERPTPAVRPVSDEERSRSIQTRAYGLWERAGRPDGDAARVACWCEAERAITTAGAS